MTRASRIAALLGAGPKGGVLVGLEGPDPGDSATWAYTEGICRIEAANPLGYTEYKIGAGTIVVVASKDYYVYVDGGTGAIASVNGTIGAAQPKIGGGTIAAKSEIIAKLVSTADPYVSSVADRRGWADAMVEDLGPFSIGFETADVGDHYFTLPFDGRILALDGTVVNALAATDAGTVTPSIVNENGTARAVTNAVLSFAASAAVATRDLECASANNYFQRGELLKLAAAKSTAGGLVSVQVVCEVLGW